MEHKTKTIAQDSTANIYRIKNWEETFERSQGRKSKVHHWVAMPVKHDGAGFRRISIQPNSAELFAAWCLIIQVAAKCPVRGTLADGSGKAVDSEDMAIKTGFPVAIFEAAFEFFNNPKIGWLTTSESDFTTSKGKDYQPATSKTQSTTIESVKSGSEKAHSTVHNNTRQTTTDGGSGLSKEFFERHDEYHFIANCEPLSKITIERYAEIKRGFPEIKDFKKTLREICLKAKDPDANIKKPDPWLVSNLSYASQRDENTKTPQTEWDKIIKRGCIVC